MSSVVTTSENGLKMKIKRRSSSTTKAVPDQENVSGSRGLGSPFKQKFLLESATTTTTSASTNSSDKRRLDNSNSNQTNVNNNNNNSKLSAKILQSGKSGGKAKKQSKPLKEKKIKKRAHSAASASANNVGKCLPSSSSSSFSSFSSSSSSSPSSSSSSSSSPLSSSSSAAAAAAAAVAAAATADGNNKKNSLDCLHDGKGPKANGSDVLQGREDQIKRDPLSSSSFSSSSSSTPLPSTSSSSSSSSSFSAASSSSTSSISSSSSSSSCNIMSDGLSRPVSSFQTHPGTSPHSNPDPKVTERQMATSSDKGTEAPTRNVETETIHVGVVTDPDCLGPCEPGTSVVLEGIVWNESDNGILVVNVTWRGKTYVGTLMDSTKHHWAPPRFSEEELNASAQTAYGGWGGSGGHHHHHHHHHHHGHHQKSRGGDDAGETRKPRRCRKDAAALASHSSRLAKTLSGSSASKENQSSAATSGGSGCGSIDAQSSKNTVGLFECQEESCSKKFKHLAGLRYHQSHAHCRKKDTDKDKEKDKSSASSDSRCSPSGKCSEKQQQPSGINSPEDASVNKSSPVTVSCVPGIAVESAPCPAVVVSKSSQPESTPEDVSGGTILDMSKPQSTPEATQPPPPLREETKPGARDVKDAKSAECGTSRPAEQSTKEAKTSFAGGAPSIQVVSKNVSPPVLSRKELADPRVDSKEVQPPPMETGGSSLADFKPELGREQQSWTTGGFHRPHESKEAGRKLHSFSSTQDSYPRHPLASSALSSSSSSFSSFSSSSSSSSSSSNAKKHQSTAALDTFPPNKKMKTFDESREEDHFYRAFRSMFESSALPLDYFIDPFYRAQPFPMMADPLLFHKSLDGRGRSVAVRGSCDDMKPVDMSSKKTTGTPKPEVPPHFWPSYLPAPASSSSSSSSFSSSGAGASQNPCHFFGLLKDCGPDNTPRTLGDVFPAPLPSPKSLPKLQRFAPQGRFHESGSRRPGSGGGVKDEAPPSKGHDREFGGPRHKKADESPGHKNGKLKEEPRRPTPAGYPKQDVFRSPLPPPLLPSSFPFFPNQHPGGYSSSSHLPPYPLDSLDKPSVHPRHPPSHLSPTVGDRFKFPPSGVEPSPPSKLGGALGGSGGSVSSSSSSGGGCNSVRSAAVSLPSTSKSHLEPAHPPPKHHLHTHHHTHIIKTPYPMYSQYAASLLSPPIVPTVVVPEIFSPK